MQRQAPELAAAALINMFPGQTLTQKASSVVLASSVAAWLISKEIYVIDGEFFEVLALFGAYYLWYIGGKDGVKEFFNERQDTIRRVLNEAREQHKEVVKERMAHISSLENVVDTTKGLFELSKSMVQMEAEIYQLKQKVAYTNEVKSVLDSWVRHEAGVRERQQKLLAESVIAKVKAELANPKTQNDILSQTILDVEKILSASKAA
ncbi:atp4 subunit B of the stator stalk of mitochondrial F1F0 ATP synthase [Cladochytrium tenue]|nr:atp4 subunit B of the stator stalk of mitochondrial F1F0 ATP synthase [Cladochytrium tenue]